MCGGTYLQNGTMLTESSSSSRNRRSLREFTNSAPTQEDRILED